MTVYIPIEDLDPTLYPNLLHRIPAMKDGVGVYLTVQQIVSLAQAAIVDGAPEALDTLNELAAALNDDAAFNTTVLGLIGEKLAKSILTTPGDLLVQDGSGATRLGIGTAGQSLRVNSGGTALVWETVITPWVSYPAVLVGAGTATNTFFQSRRVGDSLDIRGTFTTGTVSAITASLSLGFNGVNSGITLNTAKLPSSKYLLVGASSIKVSTNVVGFPMFVDPSVSNAVFFGLESNTSGGLNKKNGSDLWASTTEYSFTVTGLPITGW